MEGNEIIRRKLCSMFYHMVGLHGVGVKTLKNYIALTLCLCLQKHIKSNIKTFVDESLYC